MEDELNEEEQFCELLRYCDWMDRLEKRKESGK
jgi:hypothetical protein